MNRDKLTPTSFVMIHDVENIMEDNVGVLCRMTRATYKWIDKRLKMLEEPPKEQIREELFNRFDRLDAFEQKELLELLFSRQKKKSYHIGQILGGYWNRGDVECCVEQFCDRTNRTMDDREFNDLIDYIFDYFLGLEFGWIYDSYDEFVNEAIRHYYGEE